MTRINDVAVEITPDVLLKAYACGIFPMAESATDPGLYWIEPELRGVLPLGALHVSSRLSRTVRSDLFEIRVDTAFDSVMDGCAAPAPGRKKTWINGRIRKLYGDLHAIGRAHSVEAWRGGALVGGLYGVRLGAAFFGESMFHVERDASKVALVHLAARLIAGRFKLLDTQFVTEHLKSFGAVETPRREYHQMLEQAVVEDADFFPWGPGVNLMGEAAMTALKAR